VRKFYILLKKEIRELLTLQIIAPLVLTAVLFIAIGGILGKEQKKAQAPQEVLLQNLDKGALSQTAANILDSANLKTETIDPSVSLDNALNQAREGNKIALLVIPADFENKLLAPDQKSIEVYTIIRGFSITSGQKYNAVVSAVELMNRGISNILLAKNLPTVNPDLIKSPVRVNDFLVVGGKKANINPALVMGFVTQQTMFIPIILFFVIVFASQMIATANATEKENKTLETLLTTPVDRRLIVISKMTAAGIVALLASLIYLYGFRSYMQGITGGQVISAVVEAIKALGLTFTPLGYVLLGISLFVGILAALSIALILGAFAEDIKSVAGLTAPLMVLVAIPYFLTLFLDVNSLSPILRYITYAIPFSHIFLAAPNIFLGNYLAVVWGILYQLVFFLVFAMLAAKIFSTDLIMTLKLNFGKKK